MHLLQLKQDQAQAIPKHHPINHLIFAWQFHIAKIDRMVVLVESMKHSEGTCCDRVSLPLLCQIALWMLQQVGWGHRNAPVVFNEDFVEYAAMVALHESTSPEHYDAARCTFYEVSCYFAKRIQSAAGEVEQCDTCGRPIFGYVLNLLEQATEL